jgi:hypothetical protein
MFDMSLLASFADLPILFNDLLAATDSVSISFRLLFAFCAPVSTCVSPFVSKLVSTLVGILPK